jgi:hypothetical protein
MKQRNEIPADTTYRVVEWSTGTVLQTYEKLSEAKKACRDMGYEDSRLFGRAPIAFVQCDVMIQNGWDDQMKPIMERRSDCCIYNPRFK